jgi:hypothetical protein
MKFVFIMLRFCATIVIVTFSSNGSAVLLSPVRIFLFCRHMAVYTDDVLGRAIMKQELYGASHDWPFVNNCPEIRVGSNLCV